VTTQQMLIIAIATLWTVTSGSMLYIRTMYNQRLTDKDAAIAKLEARLGKLEADKEEILRTRERTMTAMEESVNTQKQQFEVMQAMYDKVTSSDTRRRSAGD
jgi:hypothetical protein